MISGRKEVGGLYLFNNTPEEIKNHVGRMKPSERLWFLRELEKHSFALSEIKTIALAKMAEIEINTTCLLYTSPSPRD